MCDLRVGDLVYTRKIIITGKGEILGTTARGRFSVRITEGPSEGEILFMEKEELSKDKLAGVTHNRSFGFSKKCPEKEALKLGDTVVARKDLVIGRGKVVGFSSMDRVIVKMTEGADEGFERVLRRCELVKEG